MKKINKSDIETMQHVLTRMNERIDLTHEIELWNHCVSADEQIEIVEDT